MKSVFLLLLMFLSIGWCSEVLRQRKAHGVSEYEVIDVPEIPKVSTSTVSVSSYRRVLRDPAVLVAIAASVIVVIIFAVLVVSLLLTTRPQVASTDEFRVSWHIEYLEKHYTDNSVGFPLRNPTLEDFKSQFGDELGTRLFDQMVNQNILPADLPAEVNLKIGKMFPKAFWLEHLKFMKRNDPKLNQLGAYIGHPTAALLILKNLAADAALNLSHILLISIKASRPGLVNKDFAFYANIFSSGHVNADTMFWSASSYQHEPEYVQTFLRRLTSQHSILPLPSQHAQLAEFITAFGVSDGNKIYQQIVDEEESIDNLIIVDDRLARLVDTEYWLEQMMRARDAGDVHYDSIELIKKAIGAERAAFLAGLVFTEQELPLVVNRLLPIPR